MTKKQIQELFANVEGKFEESWQILSAIKAMKNADRVFDFQSLLTSALAQLSDAYRTIAQKRKSLIANKERYKREWFAQEQRRLARWQGLIRNAISMGRVMGDAFAWFWYQNDQQLLEKHQEHKLQELLPPGIGGKGERAFVETVPQVGGKMAIYTRAGSELSPWFDRW